MTPGKAGKPGKSGENPAVEAVTLFAPRDSRSTFHPSIQRLTFRGAGTEPTEWQIFFNYSVASREVRFLKNGRDKK